MVKLELTQYSGDSTINYSAHTVLHNSHLYTSLVCRSKCAKLSSRYMYRTVSCHMFSLLFNRLSHNPCIILIVFVYIFLPTLLCIIAWDRNSHRYSLYIFTFNNIHIPVSCIFHFFFHCPDMHDTFLYCWIMQGRRSNYSFVAFLTQPGDSNNCRYLHT
jgi:hypothetical protein